MKLAYACNCLYRSDAVSVSIYADVYLKYVADFAEGSYLHLAVVIAKENGCVVSGCAECIGKTVNRLSILPEYPENIDCICNRFFLQLRKYLVIVFRNDGTVKKFLKSSYLVPSL